MPELPEVETVRRGLQPVMDGSRIVKADARRKDLRFPFQKDFAARLTGQTVTGLGRRAKYLLADLASGDVLLMHLGMSGSFRVVKDEDEKAPGKFHHPRSHHRAHDHVVFHMSSGAAVIFNDPRRFGYMKVIARKALDNEPLLRGLGPEPLGNEFDARMLARSCANKKTSLKAALLDQRRTGLFPALVSGLRSRRPEMPDGGLQWNCAAIYPERTLNLLVPEMPEVRGFPRLGPSHASLR
jgi:formamidopyrimidine-DNA glycosylase